MRKMKYAWLALSISSILSIILNGCSYDSQAATVKKTEPKPVATQIPNSQTQPHPSSANEQQKVPANVSKEPVDNQNLKQTEEQLIFSGPRTKKEVALTFDDGPDGKYTPEILNILKRYHVHATFFVIGDKAKVHPNMIKRMADEGHVVANHTWDHPFLPKLSDDKVKQEVLLTNQIVKQITGKNMVLMRPPYGAVKAKVQLLQDMGFSIIEWDVDTLDWKKGRTPSQILGVIKKETRPGSIILEHCGGGPRQATVEALPKIIKYLNNQGYQFVTIDQMLGIPAYR